MPFLDVGGVRSPTATVDATSFLGGPISDHSKEIDQDGESQWLVVSPYSNKPHLLDLSAVEPAQALLARALTTMTPICDNYATAPYTESFNWTEVMLSLKKFVTCGNYYWKTRTFFIIVFRSQVKPQTDRSRLGDLDERSHAEAMRSGGLLKYWFGVPDANYRNLATCESLDSPEWTSTLIASRCLEYTRRCSTWW